MATKYIFVTGGVVSSLGKGITAASLGRLLKNRGFNVTIQKFDPYINIDPGTMSPYQHGEVFVTDDGAETDLDLGHYERFIDINLSKRSNITAGKVYWSVINKERKGDYLGSTVQVIPHVTNEIKQRGYTVGAGVNIPLDGLFDLKARVNRQKLAVKGAMLEKEVKYEEMKREIIDLYATANSQLSVLKLRAEALELATLQYEIAEKDFTNGAIDSGQLSIEKQRQSTAMEAYEKSKFELTKSLMILEVITRTPILRK